jgi:hypothetical protein
MTYIVSVENLDPDAETPDRSAVGVFDNKTFTDLSRAKTYANKVCEKLEETIKDFPFKKAVIRVVEKTTGRLKHRRVAPSHLERPPKVV